MNAEDPIEITPLMPLSGETPLSMTSENKAQLILTPDERLNMQQQILAQSLPWTAGLLVPILAFGLYSIIRQLKSHHF